MRCSHQLMEAGQAGDLSEAALRAVVAESKQETEPVPPQHLIMVGEPAKGLHRKR